MLNSEFEHQKRAYNNYIKLFIPELQWTNTIYKDLYNILERDFALTKVSMGDYFFEQYVNDIKENLNRIENEVNAYILNNNFDKIQKEQIFYHKPLLENRINELTREYNSKKASTEELSQQINNSAASLNTIFIETTSNEKFNNYLKLHIIEPYVDYSYLFQRMLKENIIVKIKHLDFVNWLFNNKHITENIKDLILKNNGFRSLKKSYSIQRENNFNNIFNL